MPPPHLPPPERGESESAPTPGFRRHVGKLFWVGVAIAPLAALLLVLGSGVGPLRAAAVLAVFSVVIIGLSVVLRDDAAMVKDDVEEQLRTEVSQLRNDIDSLRRGVEVSVHRELERVHRELEATRRDSVLRAESTRLNRLTGALPAGEDDYPVDSRGRGDRPMRAITAPADGAPGEQGYDWFGSTEGEAGAGQRQEPIRYGAGTYGSARPADPSDTGDNPGNWPRRPAEAEQAASARRSGGGTEYGRRRPDADDSASRYQSYQASTYGSGGGNTPNEPRSGGRRRAPEEDSSAYELIDYDDAPPAYTPQRIDTGVYGSRTAGGDDRSRENSGEHGTIDYGEFWDRSGGSSRSGRESARGESDRRDADSRNADSRSIDPRNADPRNADHRNADPRSAGAQAEGAREADRRDGDRSSASEWSSWRENTNSWDSGSYGWDTGSQRFNSEDPQVITGAITGDVFDVPYSVGGQSLSEPSFGSGNGFAAGSGFGSGNGFGAKQRWDELPDVAPAPEWQRGSDRSGPNSTVAEPSAEFELPSLEHLPQAPSGGSDDEAPARRSRHASIDEDSGPHSSWERSRSW
ncbi:hypothetical protein [Cryptosporangium sp. NPDC048952]|uniref:hypothetical protein n=1 Tax=Cryptosporangium sp. NPDC048952 TaxID=3363961 RepID=UPI003722C793